MSQNSFISVLKHYGLYQPEELYKVVCPFHGDKNPSMQINIPKQFFYCYGCGAKGSTLELYNYFQQKKGADNKSKNSSKLVSLTKILKSQEGEKSLYNIYNNINNISNTLSFVESKKLSYKEGIKKSRIYYNSLPDANWFKPSLTPEIEQEVRECKTYMLNRGFTPLLLHKAQAKASLNKYYPIIFPLLENGKFRGYVMRTFDKEIEQQRKYMYNKGFKRELILPGIYPDSKPILLVEGYLDCLKGQQLGIKNIAAILGWKISQNQLEKIKAKGCKTIICGLDNDEAGIKGYKYLKRIGKLNNISVVRLRYPKGIKDMGDINKNTKNSKLILNQLQNIS